MSQETVTIAVIGPVGSGKSILTAAIAQMLKERFGIEVQAPELEHERRMADPDNPTPEQLERLRNTPIVLSEASPSWAEVF